MCKNIIRLTATSLSVSGPNWGWVLAESAFVSNWSVQSSIYIYLHYYVQHSPEIKEKNITPTPQIKWEYTKQIV